MYCALEAGQRETAKLLIDRGADTYSSSDGNNSLVELAAKHGFFDIAERLSDTNNAIVEKLENGNTLLTLAAGRGDYDSVRFLLKKGDDVGINARNTSGDTALSCAIRLAGHMSLKLYTSSLILELILTHQMTHLKPLSRLLVREILPK